ncbi:MAG: hypothetical protein ACOCUD_03235 [Bacillota bacterium]
MRIITALKLLVKYYYRIIPTYLLAAIIILIAGQILPVIGAVLVLPVSIGVAYVMVFEVASIKKREFFPILIGFKKGKYQRNLGYLFLRQIVQYLPLGIGLILDQLNIGPVSGIKIDLYFMVIGYNFFIFAIPSALLSLLFSMVPYILADPQYIPKRGNPLKISALLLRGNYLRLISIRLVFLPFILWAASGLIISLTSFYSSLFGNNYINPNIVTSWLFSAPILFMFITPWYQMSHAVLYGEIRYKLKDLMVVNH